MTAPLRALALALAAAVAVALSTGPAAALELEPTTTCPPEAVEELGRAIEFVRSQTWAAQPGSSALNIAPDLDACRVVLHVGSLGPEEEAALLAGAGPRLTIEYRRDWARSSRLPLLLWVIFGGSAVLWTYRRYARS
jgi:hypothetical protein